MSRNNVMVTGELTAAQIAVFWSRVTIGRPGDCWPWAAGTLQSGYGRFWASGSVGRAHRVAYELSHGEIPDGKHLDHLCHNVARDCQGGAKCPHRKCVNPLHLEVADPVVNIMRGQAPTAHNARKTHCKRGHELVADNILRTQSGGRRCAPCAREYVAPTINSQCRKGHPYDEVNTYLSREGRRSCRTCNRAKAAQRRRTYRPPNLVTHCRQGHLYDEANTYLGPNGYRGCRACGRIKAANRRAEMKGITP